MPRDDATADQLHHLLVDLLRYANLLHPDQPARGHPLPITQVFALHELDTGAPLSQRDLADRLGLEKSTVSRLVADMQAAGLLVRERDPENRRFYRLRITARGRAAHARTSKAFRGRYQRLVSDMTASEREALTAGLPALIRVLRTQLREERPSPSADSATAGALGGRVATTGSRRDPAY